MLDPKRRRMVDVYHRGPPFIGGPEWVVVDVQTYATWYADSVEAYGVGLFTVLGATPDTPERGRLRFNAVLVEEVLLLSLPPKIKVVLRG